MEEVTVGDRAMATFVTLTEEDAVISAGIGQESLGRHKRDSEQQKNYPGKARSCDKPLVSLVHTFKGISLFCNVISKDSNLGQQGVVTFGQYQALKMAVYMNTHIFLRFQYNKHL